MNIKKSDEQRIVITGIGVVSPCGNSLDELRTNILNKHSGVKQLEVPHVGKVPAGVCQFDEYKYQSKKMRSRGTRAGSISIFAAHQAIEDSKISWDEIDKSRVGIFLGIAEHGNGENERELESFFTVNQQKISLWSYQHNFKTIANSPAGEVSINLKITGPHFTIGGACAAGNMGLIQGVQQLLLGEVDYSLAGGVSESTEAFGTFASFLAQGALAQHPDAAKSCRPLDVNRNGIVIAEGGGFFLLERLSSARKRNARIYGEIIGYHYNSDAGDFLLPMRQREVECMKGALKKSGLNASDIDLVNMHATGTPAGDLEEALAIEEVFGESEQTYINASKGFFGHAMGAASLLEWAANISSLTDGTLHSSINVDQLDPQCPLKRFIYRQHVQKAQVRVILKNSFGMMGLNTSVIIQKFEA